MSVLRVPLLNHAHTILTCEGGEWFLEVSYQYWTIAKVRLGEMDVYKILQNAREVEEKIRLSLPPPPPPNIPIKKGMG